MDSSLYKTITSGNIDELKQIMVSLDDQFVLQMTPLKNTSLHVAVQCNKRLCVEEICNRYPSLLRKANSKGNTPLHLAARLGFFYIVSFLIYCSKTDHEDVETGIDHQRIGGHVVDEGLEPITVEEQLVRMRNVENDTALHEAVRNHQFEVVKLLTEADRVFEYCANKSGETPLYLAAEEGLLDCVSQILQTCSSSAHGGPNGRTALHAAVMSDHSEITRILLEKKPTTIKESDDNGWIPLHYAAELNLPGRVVQLLDFDSSVAYLQDNDGKTALHIAASKGLKNIIEAVTRYCPDCWEVINNQGQNFLHVAAESGRLILIRYLLSYAYVMFEGLINEADNNGNTPLHLAALKGNYAVVDALNKDYRVNKRAINKDNLTALDVFKSKVTVKGPDVYLRWFMRMRGAVSSRRNPVIGKDEDIEMINDPKEIGDTHLLVATLIATMTFTAGFTLPGGYKGDGQDQGMAVLTKRAAFQAFVISDAIAMLLSTATVFIYFLATIFPNKKITSHFIEMATQFTITAIAAMVVAFMTGMYTVLGDSLALSIAVCVIGSSFFILHIILSFFSF